MSDTLTWEQAIKAYAEGKRIRDCEGDEFWLENGRARTSLPGPNSPASRWTPFTLVQEEEKSLSFDEAFYLVDRGEEVQVKSSQGDIKILNKDIGSCVDMWAAIALLDLAERKGWKITEVKG